MQINEYNGAGETKSANITNTNVGSVDAANLDAVANPIVAGENSYEKYQTFEITAMGGSSEVNTLKVWRTGALGANATHLTNARETSYGGAEAYATPVATASSKATQTMPSTEPTGANLGIGGSLSGALSSTGESDRLVHQLQTTGAATAGTTSNMNYQYDEVA
jgi:hypothetical protein